MILLHLFTLLLSLQSIYAVKFEIEAQHDPIQRCLSQFINKDVLVAGKVLTHGDNQRLEVEISDGEGNQYFRKQNIDGEVKFSFTTHAYGDVNFCFLNTLDEGHNPSPDLVKYVHLEVETGAEAMDYSQLAKDEQLKPMEIELRRLEGMMDEINQELDRTKLREIEMRDTNESTNDRVKLFSTLSIGVLIGLGIWQIVYLRKYFRTKKLI